MVIERQFLATSGNDWCDIQVGGVVVRLLDDPIPRRVHEKRFQYGECYLAEHPSNNVKIWPMTMFDLTPTELDISPLQTTSLGSSGWIVSWRVKDPAMYFWL